MKSKASMNLLMGLNEEYRFVRTQILSTNPLPTLEASYHLISRDEQQKHIGNTRVVNNDSTAFQASRNNPNIQNKNNTYQLPNKRKNDDH